MMQKVLVIHGPNLNLLGEREPGVYGNTTFADLNRMILDRAEGLGLECEIFQSNHEGAIIDKLHAARNTFDGVVINAGAYTHYSYAIHDAIHDIRIPLCGSTYQQHLCTGRVSFPLCAEPGLRRNDRRFRHQRLFPGAPGTF